MYDSFDINIFFRYNYGFERKAGKKNKKKIKKKKIDVQIVISPCIRRLLCMTSLPNMPPFTEHLSHTNLARQLVAQISTSFVSK